MTRILQTLLPLLVLLAALPVTAHAGHQVEVLETYPPGDRVELAPGQEFHLRLAYTADPFARIFARPYLHGREVSANASPSPAYRGTGETTVWFSFVDADARADEVRIFVGNSSGLKRPALVRRVSIVGSANAGALPPAPAWVATLKGNVEVATGGPQQPLIKSDRTGLRMFMAVMFGIGVFGLVAPAWCFRRWRGRWRIAAAVPMVAMFLFVAFLLLTAVFAPDSLGLFPFVVLMVAVPCSLAIVAMFVARKLTGADGRNAA